MWAPRIRCSSGPRTHWTRRFSAWPRSRYAGFPLSKTVAWSASSPRPTCPEPPRPSRPAVWSRRSRRTGVRFRPRDRNPRERTSDHVRERTHELQRQPLAAVAAHGLDRVDERIENSCERLIGSAPLDERADGHGHAPFAASTSTVTSSSPRASSTLSTASGDGRFARTTGPGGCRFRRGRGSRHLHTRSGRER